MRRWAAENSRDGVADVADLIRFNRVVDRALAESIAGHNRGVRERQDRFLAILGHDLRNPLNAILMSATFMLESGAVPEPDRSFVERIAASSRRMNQMVSDLIAFARSRVTGRVPVACSDMDLHGTVKEVVSEITAAYPGCVVYAHCAGDLRGRWDSARLEQALENLVGNAIQHGDRGSPIDVTARGDATEVVLVVHNTGVPIPGDKLPELFNPMGTVRRTRRATDDHLGIGLFIGHEVVTAHGGRIDVRSTAGEGTTFTVHLPRSVSLGPRLLLS